MIFQHTIQQVLDGSKIQTRRIVKPEDVMIGIGEFATVMNGNRVKYRVGQTLAVQPGRTQKEIARIRITAIDCEDVRQISDSDVRAEGFSDYLAFLKTWLGMHDKGFVNYLPEKMNPISLINNKHGIRDLVMMRPAERYQAWCLSFELVRA